MELKLYKNLSNRNVVNKNLIQLGATVQVVNVGSTGHEVDKLSPVLRVKNISNVSVSTILDTNYVYIDTFNRYYFCTPSLIDNGLIELRCAVDAIGSFKTILSTAKGIIDESPTGKEYYINPNDKISQEEIYTHFTPTNDTPIIGNFDTDYYLIMVTSGGGTVANLCVDVTN